ncbi:hypothetical protein V6N13_136890 [Hibiscus sabdariffa]|uniref:Uncharacterized protein n=1 Tax=Hibiscus sabdariffa TaxID=183260 RepID=A0ABR2DM94_9ROSI
MSRIFLKRHRFNRIVRRKNCINMQNKHKKKATKVKLRRLIMEQSNIRLREGHSQVREKLKAVETECEALREESKLMIQQSVGTQIRLALMLNILKAREEGDLAKAARFTDLLREMVRSRG